MCEIVRRPSPSFWLNNPPALLNPRLSCFVQTLFDGGIILQVRQKRVDYINLDDSFWKEAEKERYDAWMLVGWKNRIYNFRRRGKQQGKRKLQFIQYGLRDRSLLPVSPPPKSRLHVASVSCMDKALWPSFCEIWMSWIQLYFRTDFGCCFCALPGTVHSGQSE